jgi:hypothetical protein
VVLWTPPTTSAPAPDIQKYAGLIMTTTSPR